MDQVLNILIKLAIPALTAVLFLLIKKGISLLQKKLDIEISDKEQSLIDSIVEMAVRAVEERTKTTPMDSDRKELLALEIAKQELGNKVSDVSLRNKIKAKVSSIFH